MNAVSESAHASIGYMSEKAMTSDCPFCGARIQSWLTVFVNRRTVYSVQYHPVKDLDMTCPLGGSYTRREVVGRFVQE